MPSFLARSLACLVVGAVALASSACGSDDAAAPAPELVLYPTTKVLDAATVSEASPDLARVVFATSSPALDGVTVGDVVLGGVGPKTPSGFLRRVTAKTIEGGATVLATARASLTDAIERGTIRLPRTALSRASARVEAQPGTRVQTLRPLDTGADALARDFTIGVDAVTLVPGVKAGASLGFGIGADLSIMIDTKKIEGKLVLSGTESATIDVRALVSAELEKRILVGTFFFPPIPISIGGVPIVITTKLDVDIGVKGKASGSISWSAKEDAKVDVGLVLGTERVDTIFDGKAEGAIDPVTATASASLDAFAGLTLEAAVNAPIADASFRVGADGYVRIGTSTDASPCDYVAKVGVEGRVGVDASLLGLTLAETETKKDLYSIGIGGGACSTDPTATSGWAATVSPTDFETRPTLDVLPDGSVLLASNATNVTGYVARLASRAEPIHEAKVDGSVVVSRVLARDDGRAWLVGKNGTIPTFAELDDRGEKVRLTELVADGVSLSTVLAAKTKEGGLVLGGSALEGSTFVPWAAKVSPAGALVWARSYGGGLGEPHAIVESADGGVVLVGENASGPTAQAQVLRTTADGSPAYARTYGDGRLYGVTRLAAGGFAAVGQVATSRGAIVLRLADDGALTWGFSYEDAAANGTEFRGNAVAERKDGILVAGLRDFGDRGDGWALAVGPTGELGFSRSYGGALADDFRDVRVTADGGAVLVGETKSFGGTSKLLVAKIPGTGALAFAAASGATSSNVSGVKAVLPGAEAALAPTSKPIAVTLRTPESSWTFVPTTAKRTSLAP